MNGKTTVLAIILGATIALPQFVWAAPVICADPPETRHMFLDPSDGSAVCRQSGFGAMNDNRDFHLAEGLVEISKIEGGATSSDWFSVFRTDEDGEIRDNWNADVQTNLTAGAVQIFPEVYEDYSDVHLAFFFGVGPPGNADNWFSYSLSEVLSASWSTSWGDEETGTGQWALSNVAVWGKPTSTVPEPGILALLGLGLLGLLAVRQRRARDY